MPSLRKVQIEDMTFTLTCGKRKCKDCEWKEKYSSFDWCLLTAKNVGDFRLPECLQSEIIPPGYVVFSPCDSEDRYLPPLDVLPMFARGLKKARKTAMKLSNQCHHVIAIGPIAIKTPTERLYFEGAEFLLEDLDGE